MKMAKEHLYRKNKMDIDIFIQRLYLKHSFIIEHNPSYEPLLYIPPEYIKKMALPKIAINDMLENHHRYIYTFPSNAIKMCLYTLPSDIELHVKQHQNFFRGDSIYTLSLRNNQFLCDITSIKNFGNEEILKITEKRVIQKLIKNELILNKLDFIYE